MPEGVRTKQGPDQTSFLAFLGLHAKGGALTSSLDLLPCEQRIIYGTLPRAFG